MAHIYRRPIKGYLSRRRQVNSRQTGCKLPL